MSKFDDFDNGDVIHMNDNEPTAEFEIKEKLEEELASLRKKDRVKMMIFGFVAGMMVAVGAGIYVTQANADSNPYGYGTGYQLGSGYDTGGTYTDYSQALGSGGAVSGGGGCGGGGGGGGCGGGGAAADSASLADLEKQALDEYKKEKDAVADATAKAANFGCHIQIDISDKSGNIVRSYGFQGSSLYVIK